MATVKAVLVPIDQQPREIELEDTLEAKQKLVDGYIDILSCRGDELEFIVNDDGLITKKPNRAIFANKYMVDKKMYPQIYSAKEPLSLGDLFTVLYGDFIIAKYNFEKDIYVDMTDDEIQLVCEEFADQTTGKDALDLLKVGLIWRNAI